MNQETQSPTPANPLQANTLVMEPTAPAKNDGISSGALLTGAAVALGAASLLTTPARAVEPALKFSDIPGEGDFQVLNYALALELLEADLYRQALLRLDALGVANSQPDVQYLQEFGTVENEHRDFLITAIKGAGGIPINESALRGATFDFGMNQRDRRSVIDLVLLAEATGVKAYLGAIVKFQAGSPYLQTAAAIQGTEARHTSVITIIRNIIFNRSDPVAPLQNQNNGIDTTLSPNEVLKMVSPFIVLGNTNT